MSDPSRPALEEEPLVIVVSGPGGVGKGTVVNELLRRDPSLFLNVSWTTREPRPGEPADSYRFATREEFENHIAEGGFLEWVEFLDYLQGSPVPDPPAGDDVLFEIDVAGGAKLKEMFPDALLIFIDAPDRSVQEQRLRGRGDDEERIRQRVARATDELARAIELNYQVVINDDLDVAVKRVQGLISEARSARGGG